MCDDVVKYTAIYLLLRLLVLNYVSLEEFYRVCGRGTAQLTASL